MDRPRFVVNGTVLEIGLSIMSQASTLGSLYLHSICIGSSPSRPTWSPDNPGKWIGGSSVTGDEMSIFMDVEYENERNLVLERAGKMEGEREDDVDCQPEIFTWGDVKDDWVVNDVAGGPSLGLYLGECEGE